jgi:phosphate butyryltransferase
VSAASAREKGYNSEVAGAADILLAPDMTAGNILGKALVFAAGARMAGLVVGASAPIVLTSRGSSADEKFLSLVLSAAYAAGVPA